MTNGRDRGDRPAGGADNGSGDVQRDRASIPGSTPDRVDKVDEVINTIPPPRPPREED